MTIHSKSKTKGFTLIEVLVVIAIIAALAGISFPVAKSMMNRSKSKETQLRMQEFVTAINAYEEAYGHLPYANGTYPDSDQVLSGNDLTEVLSILLENDKSTKFLTMQEAKGGNNGLTYTGSGTSSPKSIVDSWGEELYILIDYDLDSKLEQDGSSDTDKTIQGKTAILISKGGDRKKDGKDDVYSWK